MLLKPIKTRALIPPKDDLFSAIKQSFLNCKIKENSIIVITSKVVSINEGRCVKISDIKNKDELIKQEADFYLDRKKNSVMLTIKNNILIPTSGIDESNAKGYYILWPKNLQKSAKELHKFFTKNYKIKNLGIIISDSHTTPLRTGVVGIGIAYYGFYPLRDYRGKKDIFGRKLKMTQTNIVDSLAASAVYKMGEGNEQIPIIIIEDAGKIKFGNFGAGKKDLLNININQDIYSPVLKSVKWKKL